MLLLLFIRKHPCTVVPLCRLGVQKPNPSNPSDVEEVNALVTLTLKPALCTLADGKHKREAEYAALAHGGAREGGAAASGPGTGPGAGAGAGAGVGAEAGGGDGSSSSGGGQGVGQMSLSPGATRGLESPAQVLCPLP